MPYRAPPVRWPARVTSRHFREADLVTVVWARASSVVPVITRDHPTGSIGHACNLTWRVGWSAGSYIAREAPY